MIFFVEVNACHSISSDYIFANILYTVSKDIEVFHAFCKLI